MIVIEQMSPITLKVLSYSDAVCGCGCGWERENESTAKVSEGHDTLPSCNFIFWQLDPDP